MSMDIVPWDVDKYQQKVLEWWDSRQGVDFPVHFLPDTGRVAVLAGRPIAACFIYLTNSRVAHISWPITDPETHPEVRSEAINMCIEALHKLAKECDYKHVWTTSGIPKLQDRFEELGYMVGDLNINQYIKEL